MQPWLLSSMVAFKHLISNEAPHSSKSSECPVGMASLPLMYGNDSGVDLRVDRCQVGFAELCC